MKPAILLRFLPLCLFLLLLAPRAAKAQLVQDAVCFYESNCVLVEYTAIQEESPSSATLLVVLSAFVNADSPPCSNIDGLIFTPVGGVPVTRSNAQLAANPFVEMTVNRALFEATPDVIVASYIQVPVLNIPLPTNLVDLQARLDGDDPCLPVTPLPVELVSFTGSATAQGVVLAWRTASEQDNKQFEVEHSTDGHTFSQLGVVPGHGNSNVPLSYTYTDPSPASGTNYYRLKQVDFSGAYEYSKVVAVELRASNSLQVTLVPNPCTDGDCHVIVTPLANAPDVQLQLQDLSGKVVLRKTLQHQGSARYELPLEELATRKGLFILSATSGGQVVHQRVLLQ